MRTGDRARKRLYGFFNIDSNLHNSAGCVTNISFSGEGYSKTMDLSWNSQYPLTAVSTNGTECERNGFDALGRRAWNWDGRETNYFVWDGMNLIADVDTTGGLRRAYVYGPAVDDLLAITVYTGATVQTYYCIKDIQGTVHALVNDAGQIVESYRFDAWGRVLGVYSSSGSPIPQSAVGNRFLWMAREYSWQTGYYFFRSRFFDPISARWLSKDRIGIAGGLNDYAGFGGNPIMFLDPDGSDLILVGQGGPAGGQFMMTAQTWARTHPGQHQIIQVSTGEEAIRMMRANAISMGGIQGMQYFGHSSPGGLFTWAGPGDASLYRDDVCQEVRNSGGRSISDIDPNRFAEGTYVGLHGCNAAAGDNSVAQALANRIGRNVAGSNIGMQFGGVQWGRAGQGLPATVPANYSGPMYMVPNPGGGYQVMRPQ